MYGTSTAELGRVSMGGLALTREGENSWLGKKVTTNPYKQTDAMEGCEM